MTRVRVTSPGKLGALTGGAAAVVAGGIFALMFGGGLTLTDVSIVSTADVTGVADTVDCTLALTSNDPVLDATCGIVSPGGIERACSSSTPATGTTTNGTWICPIALEADIEGGVWAIQYIAARDTAAPGEKWTSTNAEILAEPDLCSGIQCVAADLQVTVTSTNEDTAGPVISVATALPNSGYQIYGATPVCVNTVADTTEPIETGCTAFAPSNTSLACTTSGVGGVRSCDLPFTAGAEPGVWNVSAVARDAIGNRSQLANNSTVTVNTGGLAYESCPGVAATSGWPLALTVDTTGNAWFLGEFHTHLGFVDETSRGPCSTTAFQVPHFSAGTQPFTYNGSTSQRSVWGESILYEPTSGATYFSQGGGNGDCNTTIACTAACCIAGTPCTQNPPANLPTAECVDINHSRIVSYNPTGSVWKGYNLPGVRNEANGIAWDAARGWLWVVETGWYSDEIGIPCVDDGGCDCDSSPLLRCTHEGSIIAFNPSHVSTFEDINWQWEAEAGGGDLTGELCTGIQTPDDGCYQRFPLAVEDSRPAHLVVDPSGFVWYTNFWALDSDGDTNSIGRLDPSDGTTINYPTHVPRCTSAHACPFVGSGPWEIKISPDNQYVVFNEYFDSDLVRMPLSRATDAACQSRVGNANPCMEEVPLEPTVAVHDLEWINVHSINFHPNGTLWFTAASPIDSVLTDNGFPSNYIASVLGFVDLAWTHTTQLIPADFTPNYNTTWDVSTAGIAINQATGEVWFNEFEPQAVGRMVCVPSYTCTSYGADCGTPDDGCGVALASCGTCGGGDTCGGGGTPWVCGGGTGGAVVSVQKHTITLAAGQASAASPTLSPAVITANSIPFITSRVTTIAAAADELSAYAVDAYFSGSTVVVATGQSAVRAMAVEVTVVEFNPAEIDIQQGTYAMAIAAVSDAPTLAPTVDTGTAFLYHTWQSSDSTSNNFDSAMVRGELAAGAATFTRENGALVSIAGHYYTAEATAATPYWTVKPVSVALTGVLSNTGTINPAITDLTQTFLIGSHSTTEISNDSYTATADAVILDASTVTVTRQLATDAVNGRYFVVEFKAAAADVVRRGTLSVGLGNAAITHDVAFTAVTEATSMVHVSGATGSFTSGSYNGALDTYVPDAWSGWTFVDTITARMTHLQSGMTEPYNVSWEVIEWVTP